MSRRNGWQMPAHSFQIIAITAFFLLSIAFYAFFAPFLGNDRYNYAAMGVYSFFAFSVLVLYVRSAAIDPADPGIAIHIDEAQCCKSTYKIQLSKENSYSISKSGNTCLEHNSTCLGITGFCCACLTKDDCRGEEISTQKQSNSDESLFCTLCNAEVNKFSKHCRSCDKCVIGFDHHCRWLNNCVGRRNYFTFLSLMTMSLFWLIVEIVIGVAVLVRCFTHKKAMEILINERLGNIFSQAPFVAVVAVCTAFCTLACVPLGELFFFHMLLIRKGITTYDYIVAMRAQSEQGEPSVREDQSLRSSPFSSAVTAISIGSSIGLQYRGAWCTPPRIFVDHQDEMVAHFEGVHLPSAFHYPSTFDPENVSGAEKAKRPARQPVGISAWKLARLDSTEAAKAAAKARASSSVLRPINSDHAEQSRTGGSSAVNPDNVQNQRKGTLRCPSPPTSACPPDNAGREDVSEEWPETPSDFSSPAQVTPQTTTHFNPVYQTWTDGSPAPSSTQTNGDADGAGWSVFWDRRAGRFVGALDPTAAGATEFMCTGQSIFFGGPLLNVGIGTSTASSATVGSSRLPRKDPLQGLP